MTENEKIELFDKWYDENYDEWAEGEEGIALREELEQAFKGGIAALEKENAKLKEKFLKIKKDDVRKSKLDSFKTFEEKNEYLRQVATYAIFNEDISVMFWCFIQRDNIYKDRIAELKSENQKWKDEWQEQVQKATDEGYARTLQTIQLNNAKEIIREFVEWATWQGSNCPNFKSIQDKAEQFLSEV